MADSDDAVIPWTALQARSQKCKRTLFAHECQQEPPNLPNYEPNYLVK